ncbi:endonuclease/exonuclease/phosphatase family protein [Streptomyces sp. NPDC055966]|uniref:endonuclease/exonuclease/phosphatase family protein n=1 Tax=Streptomyces sp. NPDC055966 TaxID=3345669 RepID=UPI0035DAA0A3
MRCATLNVLHGRRLRSDGRPAPAADDVPWWPLADAVAALDADVLALQEVDRFQDRSGRVDQAAVAADAMGAPDWRYASALHGRQVPGRGWVLDPSRPGPNLYGPRDTDQADAVPSHGVALLSRLPVREWRVLRLSPAPLRLPLRVAGNPGFALSRDQPRAAVAAVLDGGQGPFTAVALHLSFVPGWNIGQLLRVRRWIAALPRPQLLLGDFNLTGALPRAVLNGATPGPRPGREPADRWRDLARAPTYPAHRPIVQLDHVLARGVVADAVRSESAPVLGISDHRPLVVELSP